MKTLLLRRLSPLALLVAMFAGAQEDSGPPLYKVELLVFSRLGQGVAGAEAWDPTPALNYPDSARVLVDARRRAALAEEFGGSMETLATGRLLIDSEAPSPAPEPGTGQPADGDETPALVPFELLDASQRELATGALARTGRFRVLFHEAWIHPVRDRGSASSIVIDQSGDTGNWPELQGSVLVHLSRYLHLETNLWLNTAGDYLQGRWWMAAPPLAPPSVLVSGKPLHLARAKDEEPMPPLPEPEPQPIDAGGFSPLGNMPGAPVQAPIQYREPDWPFRHAVAMKQKRRMRSNEVHYLDHPLLGVVIKFTPFEDLATEDAEG